MYFISYPANIWQSKKIYYNLYTTSTTFSWLHIKTNYILILHMIGQNTIVHVKIIELINKFRKLFKIWTCTFLIVIINANLIWTWSFQRIKWCIHPIDSFCSAILSLSYLLPQMRFYETDFFIFGVVENSCDFLKINELPQFGKNLVSLILYD